MASDQAEHRPRPGIGLCQRRAEPARGTRDDYDTDMGASGRGPGWRTLKIVTAPIRETIRLPLWGGLTLRQG